MATAKGPNYTARMERLARVAAGIKRGKEDKFYGADYQLAYSFVLGEIVELQKEFNANFEPELAADPRFAEFYDRIIQILEAGGLVLLDSISPAQNRARERKNAAKLRVYAKKPEAPAKGTVAPGGTSGKIKPKGK